MLKENIEKKRVPKGLSMSKKIYIINSNPILEMKIRQIQFEAEPKLMQLMMEHYECQETTTLNELTLYNTSTDLVNKDEHVLMKSGSDQPPSSEVPSSEVLNIRRPALMLKSRIGSFDFIRSQVLPSSEVQTLFQKSEKLPITSSEDDPNNYFCIWFSIIEHLLQFWYL